MDISRGTHFDYKEKIIEYKLMNFGDWFSQFERIQNPDEKEKAWKEFFLNNKNALFETFLKVKITPLIWFIENGHNFFNDGKVRNMIDFMIDNGADINMCDELGMTPLMHAARHKDSGIVKQLIQKNPNVDTKTSKCDTAFTYASMRANWTVINMLLPRINDIYAEAEHLEQILPTLSSSQKRNVRNVLKWLYMRLLIVFSFFFL